MSVSQKISLLRRLCETIERVAGELSQRALTPSERRRLKAGILVTQRELRWLLMTIGELSTSNTEKTASPKR
jgi:hypothetical protein